MNACQIALLILLIAGQRGAESQQGTPRRAESRAVRQAPTRADTVRGMWGPLRSCYDITYYHLDVRLDPDKRSLTGRTRIEFSAVTPFDSLQIDLFENMHIERIVLDTASVLRYRRGFNAVVVRLPRQLGAGERHMLDVYYAGSPQEAKNPPWDGGFTWTHDQAGNPWIVVTCQGTGASLWWPNKDHQADEPDSMMISVTVPGALMDVSNGRLRKITRMEDGWRRFDWFVGSPINNYCVTVNVGAYSHFSDVYVGRDTITLDYYVLPENLERARLHFQQVKPMMAAFEQYFGDYPFTRDGFKLIECPHTGMEHQSAVAYGNRYLGGYRGRASSPVGLKFDFIIIHESAHEWWGNSVTAKDVADMWIHESFGAYAEALFVEYMYGYREAMTYVNGKKPNVRNREPMIGTYNVQREGSGDMYDKGQLALNTLRHALGSDSLWFSTLRGLAETYRHRTVTAEDIVGFVNRRTKQDFTYFFDQYFRYPAIPTLEVQLVEKGDHRTMRYRWRADVPAFCMPIKLTTADDTISVVVPTTSWQTLSVDQLHFDKFRIQEDQFYVNCEVSRSYLDPRNTARGQ